ncbi:hypothetical protein [Flavobacterium sp.]|uniref:hypothetical protein n=1 Tax=Flavobacterium sp. TaxID=239 RepID=UPI003527C993
MKKIIFLAIVVFFYNCSSVLHSNVSYQTRNDFKGVAENTKNEFLKQKNATSNTKSVLILSQGFKGEKIIVKQNEKIIYSEYPISHVKTKYADSFSFNNTVDLILYDNYSKEEITIKSDKIGNNKFIYVMKYIENEKTKYKITVSNTLRAMK